MKIVVLDGERENQGDICWSELEKLGELIVYKSTEPEEVFDRVKDADAVITSRVKLNESNLEGTNVKYIGVLGSRYNSVDMKYAYDKDIFVTNVPDYATEAVAQYTMALLLEICSQVGYHDALVKRGVWSDSGKWSYCDRPLIELKDKVIGIVGMGRVGKVMSRMCQAMGMKVIYYDMREFPTKAYGTFVTLKELYRLSDVITLHCPAYPSTINMINKDTISMMKDSVIIINNGRGNLVVEEDLAAALNSGKVYAAAMDVTQKEPIEKDNPLMSAKNCIITPQISWTAKESRQRLLDMAADNLKSYLEGNYQNQL